MTTDLVAKAPIDRRLAEIILPTVEGMGFELVRLRYMSGAKRATLPISAAPSPPRWTSRTRSRGGMRWRSPPPASTAP